MPARSAAPTIAVVMPAYNAAATIHEAIRSALDQTVAPLEVIVIDDGSTDDTATLIRSFGDPVRYFRTPQGGPARARNLGVREARGTHIAFLDADDVWLPTKLARQLELLREAPDLVLVYSGVSLIDEAGTVFRTVASTRACSGRHAADVLRIKNCIQVSTVVAPRSELMAAGLFDPDLPSCENWDLWIRLAARGEVGYVDTPLVHYRMREGSRIRDVDTMRAARLEVLSRNHGEHRGPLWRRALALAYLDSGIGYLEMGRRQSAAADLLHSLWIRPATEPVIELVRLVTPPAARRMLGRARRRLQGTG